MEMCWKSYMVGFVVFFFLVMFKNRLFVVFSEGLPRWLIGKDYICQCRRSRFDPWVRKIHWRKTWQPTPVFLSGECHGQRSLVGLQSVGSKESDTIYQVNYNS